MKLTYKHTIYASFTAYIVQAIINNFIPLLFLTFNSHYGIPLSRITLLITFNFGVQLVVDLLAAGFVDKIGYKVAIVWAHIFASVGLLSLAFLPEMFSDPFHGLLVSVMIYAIGGGLLEVLVSPIVEACPTDHKESVMSLLHSFYSWGQMGVVLLSTLFFFIVGIEHWHWMALFWALIPFLNAFFFSRVPVRHIIEEGKKGHTLKQLLSNKVFWLMALLMVAAGASEQSISQWASAFAESALGVDKIVGDLAGPMIFALMMGISRLFYGRYGNRIKLERFMSLCTILCLSSFLIISLSPWPFLSFIGCALSGLAVGIMWPGSFSIAAAHIPLGGTMMFAFLAVMGDLGCMIGPTVVGMVSSASNDNLQIGILAAIIFPLLMLVGILLNKKARVISKKKA